MPPVYYHLGKFPPTNLDASRLLPLASRANGALGRYAGLLSIIPNSSVLLSPLMTQEAVLSSKIEGTRITMGEVLEVEAGGAFDEITQPRRDDAEEIGNYRKALQGAALELEVRPLSQHILRQAHAILLQGVRGRDKSPGSWRSEQNWIGEPGCPMEKAGFIPIAPEHLVAGMEAWNDYLNINNPSQLDPLVQLAIVHAEFEALHPFKDGNGRLGRMLVPLFLYSRSILGGPSFYMSGYLEEHREIYLSKLRLVSEENDWTGWCEFFLNGIWEQSLENEKKARLINDLYTKTHKEVLGHTHSQYAMAAVDFFFQFPVFSTPTFIRFSGIPKPTASRIVALLSQTDILRTIVAGKGRRSSIFCFRELLNIAEGAKII